MPFGKQVRNALPSASVNKSLR